MNEELKSIAKEFGFDVVGDMQGPCDIVAGHAVVAYACRKENVRQYLENKRNTNDTFSAYQTNGNFYRFGITNKENPC